MADLYVDLTGGGTAVSPFNSWATAASSAETALEDAACVAGSRVFVKCGATATNDPDTVAASRTLTSAGTHANPVQIIGVKNGTTAAPPTNSDLVDYQAGDTDVPIIECTGGTSNMSFEGSVYAYGIQFKCGQRFLGVATTPGLFWTFENCLLAAAQAASSGYISLGSTSFETGSEYRFINTDIDFGGASNLNEFRVSTAGNIFWDGGSWEGPAAQFLVDSFFRGNVHIKGVDLTNLGANTILDLTDMDDGRVTIENCKINASLALATGTWPDAQSFVKLHNCTADTGVATSIIGFEEECLAGTVEDEQTVFRTGGATDEAKGAHAFKMTPSASATFGNPLRSPPMAIWLDGTETTVDVFICNDAAESSPTNDVHTNEVWAEVWASDATLDTAQAVLDTSRADPLTADTDIASDSSTWGTGGNNAQKISITTIAPGYEGWAFVQVCCKDLSGNPTIIYVDPKPVTS